MKTLTCDCPYHPRFQRVVVHTLECPLVLREMSVVSAALAAENLRSGIQRRERIRKAAGLIGFWTVVFWISLGFYWIAINGGIEYVKILWRML